MKARVISVMSALAFVVLVVGAGLRPSWAGAIRYQFSGVPNAVYRVSITSELPEYSERLS